jgi:hypothetical protein
MSMGDIGMDWKISDKYSELMTTALMQRKLAMIKTN